MTAKRTLIIGAAAALIAVGGAVTGVAVATGDDDPSHPLTGAEYDRVTARALEETGGGTVTETEKGDEESYYQVEIENADGSHTDVNLDRDLNVVKTKTENEAPGSEGSDGSG
jgi:uncharacterized membrane protein YkoI